MRFTGNKLIVRWNYQFFWVVMEKVNLTPNIDFVTSKTFLKSLSSFISSTLDIGSSDE